MRKYFKQILEAEKHVVGINRRNLELVYKSNPREHFYLANDKAVTKKLLSENNIPVADTYAVIERSWDIDDTLSSLTHHFDLVIKPSNGMGGNGILILTRSEKGSRTPRRKSNSTDSGLMMDGGIRNTSEKDNMTPDGSDNLVKNGDLTNDRKDNSTENQKLKSGETRNSLGYEYFTPGGKRYSLEMIKMHIAAILYGAFAHENADKCIIEQRIVPHPAFTDIFPHGIADIRVMLHHHKVLMAMLRIPTKDSGGKANLHQGAVGVGIDIETGALKNGYLKNRVYTMHPDTGIAFSGITIPYWQKILEISRRTAELVPLKFLGVDIIIDAEDGPLVIEINARPGLQIQNANMEGIRAGEGEGERVRGYEGMRV